MRKKNFSKFDLSRNCRGTNTPDHQQTIMQWLHPWAVSTSKLYGKTIDVSSVDSYEMCNTQEMVFLFQKDTIQSF